MTIKSESVRYKYVPITFTSSIVIDLVISLSSVRINPHPSSITSFRTTHLDTPTGVLPKVVIKRTIKR